MCNRWHFSISNECCQIDIVIFISFFFSSNLTYQFEIIIICTSLYLNNNGFKKLPTKRAGKKYILFTRTHDILLLDVRQLHRLQRMHLIGRVTPFSSSIST